MLVMDGPRLEVGKASSEMVIYSKKGSIQHKVGLSLGILLGSGLLLSSFLTVPLTLTFTAVVLTGSALIICSVITLVYLYTKKTYKDQFTQTEVELKDQSTQMPEVILRRESIKPFGFCYENHIKSAEENLERLTKGSSDRIRSISKYLGEQECALSLQKDFDSISFKIVSIFLKTLYVCPASLVGRQKVYAFADAETMLSLHFEEGQVEEYLKACVRGLPQEMCNDLAENISADLVNNLNIEPPSKCPYMRIICERATVPTKNIFFSACYFNNIEMMRKCLQTTTIPTESVNRAGRTALHLTTSEIRQQLEKEGLITNRIRTAFWKVERLRKFATIPAQRDGKEKDLFYGYTTPTYLERQANKHKFFPYKDTRVKFDGEAFYNADYVLGGLAIAAQGPQKKTCELFWKMITGTETRVVVMLASLKQCAQYWPGLDGGEMTFGAVTVKQIANRILFEQGKVCIFERTLEVNGTKVTHLQVDEWPDSGVVEPEVLKKLIEAIYQRLQEYQSKEDKSKVAIHCWQGIGRTGVVGVALKTYMERLAGNIGLNLVSEETTKIRQERACAVQNIGQYALLLEYDELAHPAVFSIPPPIS